MLRTISRGLIAVVRFLRHHLVNHPAQLAWQIRPDFSERQRFLVDVLVGDLDRRAAPKGRIPREHVVAGHAEGVDIGPRINGLAVDLLGTHVERRPHDHLALREMLRIRFVKACATSRNPRP